ncbi:thiamine pyrophosphate-dependent enzyme [Microbulbifer sp. SAOS-129_SWC]|uniref:alpha-keto acid decarboxylase family protein n=1 Tax=Microbulbifer sp. SAOS-129_SWC TaxID=3145235 RepID=UPI0032166576
MQETTTVADYLKLRLEQLGVEQLFGVAGNYTAGFLDTILSDPKSPITISGNANELCAGYAADGYARTRGICATYVTYSVGAFSILNTIAGSFTEQVPVLLINGAPTNKEYATERHAGLLYSHTTGYQKVDIHMFRPITAAAERIIDARQAPYQIDSALMALLTQQRPAYLEIAEDLWRAQCPAPHRELKVDAPASVTVSSVKQAVQATVELMRTKPKPLFWAGVELQRQGLQAEFEQMLEQVNRQLPAEREIRFVTSALSKSVISEGNPYFEGSYTLSEAEISKLVGDDGCIVGIGAWTIGKDTGDENIRGDNIALAAQGGVLCGADYYASVELGSFIRELGAALAESVAADTSAVTGLRLADKLATASAAEAAAPDTLGYDRFFQALEPWLSEEDILVVDAGFPLLAAQPIRVPAADSFVAQAAWLSIGYSVAAATGVKCAHPDKRVVVTVGDGAFHETCQALSDQLAYGHNTVVFVLANGIYGVEQYIVNPNPFRKPPDEYGPPNTILNKPYAYNQLPAWNFDRLAEAFGGLGRTVGSADELAQVLVEIREKPQDRFLVTIQVPETDIPGALRQAVDHTVGEDEVGNDYWPPGDVF